MPKLLAKFDFQAQYPTQISFQTGDVLTLNQRITLEPGWYTATNRNNATGFVPGNYFDDLDSDDDDRMSANSTSLGDDDIPPPPSDRESESVNEVKTTYEGTLLPSGALLLADGNYSFPDGSIMHPDGKILLPSGVFTDREAQDTTTGSVVGKRLEDGTIELPSGAYQMPSGCVTTASGELRTRLGDICAPKWPLPASCLPTVDNEKKYLRNLPVQTGIHHFAQKGDMEAVLRLLHQGVSPNLRDDLNSTPLHFTNHTVTAEVLVQHGARLDLKNGLDKEAAYWVTPNILKKLKEAQKVFENKPLLQGDKVFLGNGDKPKNCAVCQEPSTLMRGLHACKRCGQYVCDLCSTKRFYKPLDEDRKPLKCCDPCYNTLFQNYKEEDRGVKKLVEVTIGCANLVKPSQVLVAVYMLNNGSGKYQLVGQTEHKSKARDPEFSTKIYVDSWTKEKAELKLAVHDFVDATDNKFSDKNLMGEACVSLVQALDKLRQVQLENKTSRKRNAKLLESVAVVKVSARELDASRPEDFQIMANQQHRPDVCAFMNTRRRGESGDGTLMLDLTVRCFGLQDDKKRKNEPVVLISTRVGSTNPWLRLTDVRWANLDEPDSALDLDFERRVTISNNTASDRAIKFEVYDRLLNDKWVSLGSCISSFHELASEPEKQHGYRLLDDKDNPLGSMTIEAQPFGMVDVTVICRNLLKPDLMRMCNPIVAVYEDDSFIAQTEHQTATLNPVFVSKLRLLLDQPRIVDFMVFDLRNPKKDVDLVRDKQKNLIGKVSVDVSNILARTGRFHSYQLRHQEEREINQQLIDRNAIIELKANLVNVGYTTLLPLNPPAHEGVLVKRGGRVKSWKSRFCHLRGGTLAYYEDKNAFLANKRPKGTIVVTCAKVECVSEKVVAGPGSKTSRSLMFSIVPSPNPPGAEQPEENDHSTREESEKKVLVRVHFPEHVGSGALTLQDFPSSELCGVKSQALLKCRQKGMKVAEDDDYAFALKSDNAQLLSDMALLGSLTPDKGFVQLMLINKAEIRQDENAETTENRVYIFEVPEEQDYGMWLAALLQHGADMEHLRNSWGADQYCSYKVAMDWLAANEPLNYSKFLSRPPSASPQSGAPPAPPSASPPPTRRDSSMFRRGAS